MHIQIPPKLPKWPFVLGDALLLGLGAFIYFQSTRPMGSWEILGCTLCVALGGALGALGHKVDIGRGVAAAMEAIDAG